MNVRKPLPYLDDKSGSSESFSYSEMRGGIVKLELRSKKEVPEIVRLLQNVPLFSGLDKKRLGWVIRESKEISYPSGKTIFKQGEYGITFHLILDGTVEVRRGKKTLAKLGRGEFFGEMALLDEEPRSADVVAIEETRCLAMTAWSWHGFLKTNPSIAMQLLRTLAERLRETTQALSE